MTEEHHTGTRRAVTKIIACSYFSMITGGPVTTDCDFVGLLLDVKKNTTGRAAQPRNWLPGEAVEFCIFGGIQDSVKQSRT